MDADNLTVGVFFMGRSSKKPRQNKLDARKVSAEKPNAPKKDRDWTFEDILRSKTPRR